MAHLPAGSGTLTSTGCLACRTVWRDGMRLKRRACSELLVQDRRTSRDAVTGSTGP